MNTMAKVFFIGATGHIGGAVVNALLTQFPNLEITAIVRDRSKAERLEQRFPGTTAVIGDLTDTSIIEKESNAAGIVISLSHKYRPRLRARGSFDLDTSPDYLDGSPAAIKAVLRGLTSRSAKGFYIQTSGAFLVGEEGHGSRPSDQVWDDITDIANIIRMPPGRYHQAADQLVRDGAAHVNCALVSPTVVYGRSPSMENQIPITIRDIVATVRALASGFTIGQGENYLPYVHVNDLAAIYVKLFTDATKEASSDPQLWGPLAYYFASTEELSFAEYMAAIVKILHDMNVLHTNEIKQIGSQSNKSDQEIVERTAAIHGYGTNLRVRSSRAEALLGWRPSQPGVKDSLPEVVRLIMSRKQE